MTAGLTAIRAEKELTMANKPTFKQFLEMIYGLTLDDYNRMNYMQKQAVEIDYKDRYGSPIKGF